LSATPQTAEQIAQAIGAADAAETVYLVLEHLAANQRAKIAHVADAGATTFCKM
jgi:glucose-6-phosphate isomerase